MDLIQWKEEETITKCVDNCQSKASWRGSIVSGLSNIGETITAIILAIEKIGVHKFLHLHGPMSGLKLNPVRTCPRINVRAFEESVRIE